MKLVEILLLHIAIGFLITGDIKGTPVNGEQPEALVCPVIILPALFIELAHYESESIFAKMLPGFDNCLLRRSLISRYAVILTVIE